MRFNLVKYSFHVDEYVKRVQFGAFSSSRGNSSSALHSYSKRRFIRPFAPPCSLLTFSSVVVSWLELGGQWGRRKAGLSGESREKAGWDRAEDSLEEIFLNSIVQALVVVVVVIVVLFFFFYCCCCVLPPCSFFWLSPYSGQLS